MVEYKQVMDFMEELSRPGALGCYFAVLGLFSDLKTTEDFQDCDYVASVDNLVNHYNKTYGLNLTVLEVMAYYDNDDPVRNFVATIQMDLLHKNYEQAIKYLKENVP